MTLHQQFSTPHLSQLRVIADFTPAGAVELTSGAFARASAVPAGCSVYRLLGLAVPPLDHDFVRSIANACMVRVRRVLFQTVMKGAPGARRRAG